MQLKLKWFLLGGLVGQTWFNLSTSLSLSKHTTTLDRPLPSPANTSRAHNAYKECCDGGKIAFNCTPSDGEWFSRLLRKSAFVSTGKATLYWAHMRKAGGTSFGSAIESKAFNSTNEQNALFTRGFVRTVKQHARAGSQHCVDHRYANETLFVTILRHPVERYVSEYFYFNLPSKLKAKTTEERVIEWSERHNILKHSDGFVRMDKPRYRPQFIENWQTRWYTNQGLCEDLDRPPPHDSHPNYSFWFSGIRHDTRDLIAEYDLDAAKAVLDKFDVVGIAPFFHTNGCDILPWLLVAGSNNPVDMSDGIHKNKGKTRTAEVADDVATNITKHLHQQIKYDLELFEFARELSKRRSSIACCVNDRVHL